MIMSLGWKMSETENIKIRRQYFQMGQEDAEEHRLNKSFTQLSENLAKWYNEGYEYGRWKIKQY